MAMDGPKATRIKRADTPDYKTVSMMYYVFCAMTLYIELCYLQRSSTFNVFVLLQLVLTSLDRCQIEYGPHRK